MNTAFDSWLAKELGNGLVDIKFAVAPGKGITTEAIQNELLAAEAMLAAGYVKTAPTATSVVPENVRQFVNQH